MKRNNVLVERSAEPALAALVDAWAELMPRLRRANAVHNRANRACEGESADERKAALGALGDFILGRPLSAHRNAILSPWGWSSVLSTYSLPRLRTLCGIG